ncbi:MAG: flagellar transcriptional regulator FlhC [Comamonas sp.]
MSAVSETPLSSADGASANFTGKSVVAEVAEISLATSMIRLGARLQLLLSETSLSRERLSRLYREIRRELPPKGMLPFSADWHMTWMPNIHSSVFYGIYQFMLANTGQSGIQAQIEAYRAYMAQMYGLDYTGEPVLSFTRAWMMVRFFEAGMLQLRACSCCGGQFVAHAHEAGDRRFVCGLCRLPPRAGKRRPAAKADDGLPEEIQA